MSLDYPDAPPPVEWTGPIFPEPLLYSGAALWFILLVAAVIGLLAYRQRARDEAAARLRAPEHIYRTIRRVLDQALMKTGAGTIDGAQRVAEALEMNLGPLLTFGGSVSKPLGGLKKALAGEGERPHAAHVHAPESKTESAVIVSAGADRKVFISPAQIVSKEAPPHHGEKHSEPMSGREQIVAVREALEALSDYWRKDVVERDLARIQDLLIIKTSSPASARAAPPPRRSTAAPPLAASAKSHG